LIAIPTLLGDLVMAAPAIALLAQRNTQANITLLVRPEMVEFCRAYFPCHFVLPWVKTASCLFRLRGHIATKRVDYCVVMIDNKMVPIVRAAGAQRILAFPDPKGRHEGDADIVVPYPDKPCSLVDLFLRLANAAPNQDPGSPHEVLPRLQPDCGPDSALPPGLAYAIIHAGAGKPTRIWGKERYIAAARYLVEHDLHLVFTGSLAEAPLCEEIMAGLPSGSATLLAGKTDILELVSVLAQARLALGPDTGVMHLAKALGCPALILMGPSQKETFSYSSWRGGGICLYVDGLECRDKRDLFGHRFPGIATCSRNQCLYPDTPCMSGITTEAVIDSLAELIRQSS